MPDGRAITIEEAFPTIAPRATRPATGLRGPRITEAEASALRELNQEAQIWSQQYNISIDDALQIILAREAGTVSPTEARNLARYGTVDEPRAPRGGGRGGGGARVSFAEETGFTNLRQQIEFEAGLELNQLREQARLQAEEARRERGFEREERIAGERFTAGENRLARENQLRQQLIGDIVGLNRTVREIRSAERERLAATLGIDPFRSAVRAQGVVPVGMSPAEAYREQAAAELRQPIPAPTGLLTAPLPQLESQLSQQLALAEPRPAPRFGFARGGIIDLRRQDDGRYAFSDDDSFGVLVGEGEQGEGIASGTAEVMEISPRGVRVIPLRAAAQFGIDVALPRPGENPFAQRAVQALAPIYEHLGLPGVPLAIRREPERAGFGAGRTAQDIFRESESAGGLISPIFATETGRWPTPRPELAAETFGTLGVRPQLIRISENMANFWVSPSGEMMFLPRQSLQQFGLSPRDFVELPIAEARELGYFSRAGYPNVLEGGVPFLRPPGQRGRFQQAAIPLIEPTTGALLPVPRAIASIWRRLDPATRSLIMNAYSVAGETEEGVEEELAAFTPTGTGGRQAVLR